MRRIVGAAFGLVTACAIWWPTAQWSAPGETLQLMGTRRASGPLFIGTAAANANGFGWNYPLMNEPAYAALTDLEFSMIQPQNDEFFALMQPTENSPIDYTYLDQVLSWAQSHNKRVRMCCMMWNTNMPRWMPAWFPGARTQADVLAFVIQWQTQVLTHVTTNYPGLVYAYDIANEFMAINAYPAPGTVSFRKNGDGSTPYTETPGLPGLDTSVTDLSSLESIYTAARAAAPGIKLCINEDINGPLTSPQSTSLVNLITIFQSHGTPLDCVGVQMHMGWWQNANDYATWPVGDALAATGLEIHVTEMDMGTLNDPPSPGDLTLQYALYQRMSALCYQQPLCKVLQVWGPTDKYSWKGLAAHALMYDEFYVAKPARAAMFGALNGFGGTTHAGSVKASGAAKR